MNLIEEFTLSAALEPPLPIGSGPIGTRSYFDVKEGTIKGDRLQAKILGCSTRREHLSASCNVRLIKQTHL